jgi:hypothetical protein
MTAETVAAGISSIELQSIESVRGVWIAGVVIDNRQSEERGIEEGNFIFYAPIRPVWSAEKLTRFTQATFQDINPLFITDAIDYGRAGMKPALACISENGVGNCQTWCVVFPAIPLAALAYQRASLRHIGAHQYISRKEIDEAKRLCRFWGYRRFLNPPPEYHTTILR